MESLILLSYRLAMINIKTIFLKQPLECIPGHRPNVMSIYDSLPPSQCISCESVGSKWDFELVWHTQQEEGILNGLDPTISCKGALETIKL